MGDTMDVEDRVSRRLKLSDLRMLLTIVQWGSMSKAAAHLNLSQSAVSKAFGELEHTLGVRLLDRTPQGIKPTIYGTALLNRATAIFDEVRHYADIRIMPRRCHLPWSSLAERRRHSA
jgi:DNA-binding transcriptional LysR family regulator